MELHYKATCWVSMKFNSEITKEELIERLEAGELPLDIGNTEDFEAENLLETEEYVTLEENDGQATIEIMDDNPKWGVVWDNSYESKVKRLEQLKLK